MADCYVWDTLGHNVILVVACVSVYQVDSWQLTTAKYLSASFHCKPWFSFYSFQTVKLNATHTEAAHFIKDIKVDVPLGERSAVLSDRHSKVRYDFCEIPGHTSASGKETMSHSEMSATSFTYERCVMKGLRDRDRRISHDVCKRSFTCLFDVYNHRRVQNGERPFACRVCMNTLALRSTLNTHLRVHTGEWPFLCNMCKKRFTQRNGLNMHLREHTGERPFPCKLCEKRFTQLSSLNAHLGIHTGERPFLCKISKKTFTQSSNLSVHLKIHTKELPFSCKECKRRFIYRSFLKRHLAAQSGERHFSCDFCMEKNLFRSKCVREGLMCILT
jgi:uncharacterized Zn-finger protein